MIFSGVASVRSISMLSGSNFDASDEVEVYEMCMNNSMADLIRLDFHVLMCV